MTSRIMPDRYVKEHISVADFLGGRTDRQAFDAAIAAAPALGEVMIRVPDIGRPWVLGAGYLQYGGKRISWLFEDGATLNPGSDYPKLNAPMRTSRGLYVPGFGTSNDHTAWNFAVGAGALVSRNAETSDFANIQQQAWGHERGRAGVYGIVTATGQVKIASATFTANSFTPSVPIDPNPLRVGMLVDVPGTTNWAGSTATVRYTSRITGWAADGSIIHVEGWWRANGGETALEQTPPNGRKVVINPLNKIWGQTGDIILNEANGDSYGHVSGSWMEVGFKNQAGTEIESYFDRNSHPLHLYAIDLAHTGGSSDHGGGVAFMARGTHQRWWQALSVHAAQIGVHMESTPLNAGGVALLTSVDADGGPDVALRSRIQIGGLWDTQAEISAQAPHFDLGRRTVASTPEMRLHSSGLAPNYDARITATGGTGTDGQGTIRLDAAKVRFGTFVASPGGSIAGYIEVDDLPTGSTRKLAVLA